MLSLIFCGDISLGKRLSNLYGTEPGPVPPRKSVLTWSLLRFGHVLHCVKPPLHLATTLEPHQCSQSGYAIYDMEDMKTGIHFPGYCYSAFKTEVAGDAGQQKPCLKV